MSKKKLLIIGAGGHAHSIIDIVESKGDYQIIGLIDSLRPVGEKVWGYEVLGNIDEVSAILTRTDCELIVAIGDNFTRERVYTQLMSLIESSERIVFACLIHKSAYVSSRAKISAGSVVMAGASINAGCHIDEGVVINTGSNVDHDVVINKFASLAPGTNIGGRTSIGVRSFIGLGANVIHNIRVADDVCVGSGAVLINDISSSCVLVLGSPAKIVRPRAADETYL